MPTKRSRIPQRRRRVTAESDAVLRAFILGDVAAIRQALGLEVWDNSPLHVHRDGRCDYCRRPVEAAPGTTTGGCANNHEQWQLRLRLIAKAERRGGFRWADLDDPDEGIAVAACKRLALLAEDLGVPTATWVEMFARMGWDVSFPEGEPSDG